MILDDAYPLNAVYTFISGILKEIFPACCTSDWDAVLKYFPPKGKEENFFFDNDQRY